MESQGHLVGERYRLLRRVASGVSGTVWRAFDERAAQDVAVKQRGCPVTRRTRRTAGPPTASTARHAPPPVSTTPRPSASTTWSWRRPRSTDCPGSSWSGSPASPLHEVLRRGPVPAPEAARIGLAVLGALRAAHAVGIVHRAVRPAKVLLGPHGRVVLTDFGTARAPGDDSPRGAGPAADLRSLGALLHTAVEHRSPSGPLDPLIERLRAEDATRRPDAEEVARHLEAVAGAVWSAPDRKEVIRSSATG